VVAIVRLVPELERLSEIAPAMLLFRDAANAYLELARGQPARAVAAYEALFAQPRAELMPAHRIDKATYARALCAVGRAEDAQQICSSMVAALPANDTLSYIRGVTQQLAACELALGKHALARERLEQLLALVAPGENPLWLGLLHRDLARIALSAQDEAGYRVHERAMEQHFAVTRNPALMQQIEQLRNDHAIAHLRSVPKLLLRPAVAEELEDFSTAIETDELRIAQLSGRRERVFDDDHHDEVGAADTVPPARSRKQP
jgi:tetratricopeptide (TPR) repeat protein